MSTSVVAAIDVPPALSSRVMNALKADAKTVDLRSQASHFYSFAARMLELFEDEEMVDILNEVREFYFFQILVSIMGWKIVCLTLNIIRHTADV